MSRRAMTLGLVSLLASPAFATATLPPEAPPPRCGPVAATAERGDPRVRTAAQHGLDFLAHESRAWTQRNQQCYGCHVHSVTLEGLVIGRKHQYAVSAEDLALMADAIRGRSNGIHSTTFTTARAFGGVALARYDRWVDGRYTDDLLKVAQKLVESQNGDGSVKVDDTRFPVESGTMQATFQAMQTWRQAYARTADDAWLAPMRRAEGYIQATAARWQEAPRELQDLNYALLGLSAAGVGAGEALSARLIGFLRARQHHDGGWGFRDASDAFATGQSVYALRSLGKSEKDEAVARGMRWLVDKQLATGGWGGAVSTQNGSQMGEAMWAVLGLVSVDVMTVSLHGPGDGEHVEGTVRIDAEARDNQGGQVARVELFVDDRRVASTCGARLSHAWDTRGLADGKHLVDVVAVNDRGQESRRRLELYAGRAYLTQVGARFDEARQVSQVSLRNIAPSSLGGTVKLEVVGKDGKAVWTTSQRASQGASSFEWDGRGSDGKPQPKGLYTARLRLDDASGKPVQTVETQVFHDRQEVQRSTYGAVEGQLSLGAGVSANTELELVDDKGRVVQRVRTTEQGRYLFKNVSGGRYKVRAKKDGFAGREATIEAAPAKAPARADFAW